MAIIHDTTMSPGKLELLTAWLPAQPWYVGGGRAPRGTSEHGVLGHRWIYDGTRDPVLVAQLVALLQGAAEPQAQSVSNTPDPAVTVQLVGDGSLTVTGPADGTQVRGILATADYTPASGP